MALALNWSRGTRYIRRQWRFVQNRTGKVNHAPIIVLGNQKSGTTAIAALLAHHAGLSVTLDIPALWRGVEVDIREGRRSLATIVKKRRVAFRRDVIKEPYLSFMYPSVRETFPAARYVTVVRDPRDNIRSVLNRLNLPGHLHDVDREPLSDRWQRWFDPRAVGLEHATYIEVAATRWNIAADTYLRNPQCVVLARYEDFIADKVTFIATLADRVGLRHAAGIDHLVDVQFQPRGQRALHWQKFFGNANLETIESLCGDRMKELGYGPSQAPVWASSSGHLR